MRTITFETLKRNIAKSTDLRKSLLSFERQAVVACELITLLLHDTSKLTALKAKYGTSSCRGALTLEIDMLWQTALMNTDIRCIDMLLSIDKGKVSPSYIRSGNYVPEYSDKGWVLCEVCNEDEY